MKLSVANRTAMDQKAPAAAAANLQKLQDAAANQAGEKMMPMSKIATSKGEKDASTVDRRDENDKTSAIKALAETIANHSAEAMTSAALAVGESKVDSQQLHNAAANQTGERTMLMSKMATTKREKDMSTANNEGKNDKTAAAEVHAATVDNHTAEGMKSSALDSNITDHHNRLSKVESKVEQLTDHQDEILELAQHAHSTAMLAHQAANLGNNPGNLTTVVSRNVSRPSENMRIRTSVISQILQNDQIKKLVNQSGNNNQTLIIPIVHDFSRGRTSGENPEDKGSPFAMAASTEQESPTALEKSSDKESPFAFAPFQASSPEEETKFEPKTFTREQKNIKPQDEESNREVQPKQESTEEHVEENPIDEANTVDANVDRNPISQPEAEQQNQPSAKETAAKTEPDSQIVKTVQSNSAITTEAKQQNPASTDDTATKAQINTDNSKTVQTNPTSRTEVEQQNRAPTDETATKTDPDKKIVTTNQSNPTSQKEAEQQNRASTEDKATDSRPDNHNVIAVHSNPASQTKTEQTSTKELAARDKDNNESLEIAQSNLNIQAEAEQPNQPSTEDTAAKAKRYYENLKIVENPFFEPDNLSTSEEDETTHPTTNPTNIQVTPEYKPMETTSVPQQYERTSSQTEVPNSAGQNPYWEGPQWKEPTWKGPQWKEPNWKAPNWQAPNWNKEMRASSKSWTIPVTAVTPTIRAAYTTAAVAPSWTASPPVMAMTVGPTTTTKAAVYAPGWSQAAPAISPTWRQDSLKVAANTPPQMQKSDGNCSKGQLRLSFSKCLFNYIAKFFLTMKGVSAGRGSDVPTSRLTESPPTSAKDNNLGPMGKTLKTGACN